ncbi:MAG: hypothetical protein RIQ93_2467 [Verrucomicrobiota bacterium]|jgi:D-serine deaminase-like pyridoxal phosphate-dependent protein
MVDTKQAALSETKTYQDISRSLGNLALRGPVSLNSGSAAPDFLPINVVHSPLITPEPLPPPARIGMALDAVDTPALLLDLDLFERNLAALPQSLEGSGVQIRPHAKAHKCPEIALRQIAHGAVGVCCQKVSEAEALALGGVRDILISNEVVGAAKLDRLAALAQRARIAVCVDHAANVAALNEAAGRHGVVVDALVEINVGANRCGVEPGEPTLELQHLRTPELRAEAIDAAVAKVRKSVALLTSYGLPVERVTGAGTGTYRLEAASQIYNEVQPGSYIFMDADYGRNLGPGGAPLSDFAYSLFILTTVMSCPNPQRAVVDVGLKAHSVDSGMPLVHAVPGATYVRAADEHGVLELAESARLELGQKVRLIPGHCDPTVNLYDWMVGFRAERVEAIWRIAGRGAFY